MTLWRIFLQNLKLESTKGLWKVNQFYCDLAYFTSVVTYTFLMFMFSNIALDSVKKQVKTFKRLYQSGSGDFTAVFCWQKTHHRKLVFLFCEKWLIRFQTRFFSSEMNDLHTVWEEEELWEEESFILFVVFPLITTDNCQTLTVFFGG